MISLRNHAGFALALTTLSIAAAGCGLGQDEPLPFPCGKCDHLEDGPTGDLADRWRGQDRFESTAPFWDFMPLRTLNGAATLEGGAARTVEEADVFHYDQSASRLYVLNTYRGLQVIDVANADSPRLLGRVALGGYPIEMYQRGNHAFVLLNSMTENDSDGAFQGAVLRVYDIADPRNPRQVSEYPVPGSVAGSRLLSDATTAIIYVAANVYSFQRDFGSKQETFVMSFDVTDPSQPQEIDSVNFDGAGWQTHVTPDAMFLAQHDWRDDLTSIRYVDISDRYGDIEVAGVARIDGSLAWGDKGELQMDYDAGYLRVASQVRGTVSEPGHIQISTIDVSNPMQPTQLGELDVGEGHRLLAARFSGDRAYLFHMVQVDPLEVIDLSNPAQPKSMGMLEIPGWVNHIEVRGDKLITLGVDDAVGRKLALIMFDVSNPTAPVELSRATAGEGWTWTNASHDVKTFRVIDELGLVMLPVASSSWEGGRYSYKSWLQMFSFNTEAGTVATRGEVEAAGVIRAFPAGDRVITISDRALQSVDVSNLAAPRLAASLELARDVVDFTSVGAFGLMVVRTGDFSSEGTELRVVSLHDPDNTAPLATLSLSTPPGKLHKLSATELVSVASDPVSGETIITTLDFSDPLEPQVGGTFRSAELGFNRWGRFASFAAAPAPDVTRVGEALAMFTFAGSDGEEGGKLRIVDLSNRRFPHESASISLGAETVVGMEAIGSVLYVTSYLPVKEDDAEETSDDVLGTGDEGSGAATAAAILPGGRFFPGFRRSMRVAYSLRIIDLAEADKPVVSDPISVPGKFVGLGEVGEGEFKTTVVYTTDSIRQGELGSVTGFDTMMLVGTRKVRLLDIFGLPAGVENVSIEANTAYFTTQGWWSGPFFFGGTNSGSADLRPSATISSLDLSRPDSIVQSSESVLDGVSFANLAAVKNGRAYVSAGWNHIRVYDLRQPNAAALVKAVPMLGWWSGALYVHSDGRAYAPAGLFGLHTIQ